MVLKLLQKQVSVFLTATVTVLNGRDTASSYTSQKGQCQWNSWNAELTSKLVCPDNSESQMIYSLLVVYIVCPQRPFLKPVTLEIEHCALLQDSSQSESLRFIVAKCSQPELPYQSTGERNICTTEFVWQHSGLPVLILWDYYFQEIFETVTVL